MSGQDEPDHDDHMDEQWVATTRSEIWRAVIITAVALVAIVGASLLLVFGQVTP